MISEGTYLSADGLTLFYRDYESAIPSGVPVLCLPGLTRNSRDFAQLAKHISGTRRVICPDFRGRGHSDWDPNYTNYQPTTYVGDVGALLAHLDLDRIIVIGTSLGGFVAMGLAAANATVLEGVILNDIGPEVDPEGIERIRGYVGKGRPVTSWEDAANETRRLGEAALPGRDEAWWLGFAKACYREGPDGVPVLDYDPKIGDATRETPAAPPPELLWALYGALKPVPVLAIRGETSDILAPETLERMGQEKPDLITVTIPGVGHAPMLDEPVAVAAIDGFLAEQS